MWLYRVTNDGAAWKMKKSVYRDRAGKDKMRWLWASSVNYSK